MQQMAGFPIFAFSEEQLETIRESVLEILDRIGIAVKNERLLGLLRSRGFRTSGERVMVEKRVVTEYLDTRQQPIRWETNDPENARGDAPLQLYVNDYIQNCHVAGTDRIVPFTMDSLIETTKILHVLADRGVTSTPPGLPADVPPDIQPVLQYWVAATYSRQGRRPMDPKTLKAFPYVREMSEVLGYPLRYLDVWVVSPLTLGGESLESVLRFADQLEAVGVGNMGGVGSTLPIHVGDAFAVALAEVIGSALLIREAVALPISWHFGFHPTDFRSGSMVIGSPENTLLRFLHEQVYAYFKGRQWRRNLSGSVLTMAKLPGAQACAEKASMMTLSALLGQRDFYYGGALSLDEVFSVEQLLYDLELKDHVARLVKGIEDDCQTARCLADVRQAMEEGGFLGLDSTAGLFRQTYWDPPLFDRCSLNTWKTAGSVTMGAKIDAAVSELLDSYDYELEPELQQQIDRIKVRAEKDA